MQRRHLPKSHFRPHEDILDDDEELAHDEIKDYEEAHPRPNRSADRQLRGLGERNYQADHHANGADVGMHGHPMCEVPAGTHPPKGPNSTSDVNRLEELEDDIEELDEQLMFLECDLDILWEDPATWLNQSWDQHASNKKQYSGKYVAGKNKKKVKSTRTSNPPAPWAGKLSDGR